MFLLRGNASGQQSARTRSPIDEELPLQAIAAVSSLYFSSIVIRIS